MNHKTFIILLAIAAALRALFVWQAPLWYDENYTLLIARLPVERMWQAILGDVHPPLWYLIVRLIAQLIPADRLYDLGWLIRIPALMFSIASLYLFRRILRDLELPAIVQTVAFTLMAVLPFQLYYAQEARMYSMLEFFVLLAALALIEQRAWLMTFACAAMLYSQNYGAFYVTIIGIIAWLMFISHSDKKPLFLYAGYGVLAWLPWSWIVYQQANKLTGSYWMSDITIGGVLKLITDLFFGSYLPDSIGILGWGVTFIAVAIGIWYIVTQRPAHWLMITLLAFGPLALAWIVSALWQPILLYRPLIGSAPFMYLIVAWPLTFLLDPQSSKITMLQRGLFIAIFAVPLMLAGLKGFYILNPEYKAHSHNGKSIIASTVDYIRAHWQDGDTLYSIDDGVMIWAKLYAPDLPQAQMPQCGRILDALNPQTRNAIAPNTQDWQTLTMDGHRLWALIPYSPIQPICFDEALAPLTTSAPVIVIDDAPYIKSGLWLVNGN